MGDLKLRNRKGKYSIKVYMGNYNKKEFYSEMGEFFADRFYRKKLPYLINDIDKIWYLIYNQDKLIGFFGVKICIENTLISDIYIDDVNRMKIFKYMTEYLVNQYSEEEIKVLTKFSEEQEVWANLGFEVVGNRGKYVVMIREGNQ